MKPMATKTKQQRWKPTRFPRLKRYLVGLNNHDLIVGTLIAMVVSASLSMSIMLVVLAITKG